MNHSVSHVRRMLRQRLQLEMLEPRLPPGDAVLGMLVGLSLLDATPAEVELELRPLTDPWVAGAEQRQAPVESRKSPRLHRSVEDSARATQKQETKNEDTTLPHTFSRPTRATTLVTSTVVADNAPFFTQRAAGLTPAVRPTIGRHASSFPPAGLTAGINPAAREQPNAAEDFGKLPLIFEANHGQTDPSVDFIARTGDYTLFLTPTTAVFALQNSEFGIQNSESENQLAAFGSPTQHSALATQHSALATQHSSSGVALHMNIVGANPDAVPVGREQLPGIVNYFIGNDPNEWHADIPTFGGVQYDDVYPGIDLVYYGNQSRDREGTGLEYDFIVSPGADPKAIALNFAGAEGVEVNRNGNLVLHTAIGDVVQQAPLTYQEVGDSRQEVASRYVLDGGRVSFEVGAYAPTQPLVIDPLVLGYSTFLGGPDYDQGWGIAVDDSGNTYVTGYTNSSAFPTTPGAFDTAQDGDSDAFVTKLNASGTALAYSTFLGGSDRDSGFGIAVDGDGNAYVAGVTFSSDFPTTPGAFDAAQNGDQDAFVTKLKADGTVLVYSSFLGGSGVTLGLDIAVDRNDNAYVTGLTSSSNFPTTPGAFDTTYNGGKYDAFVTKLRADGAGLLYSTFLGGSGQDEGNGIAVDASGNGYVTGLALSSDFPTTPGTFDTTYNGYDAFVTKLNPAGTALVFSTFLGGSNGDEGLDIAVDVGANVYVSGKTTSNDFPTTPGAFDTTSNGGFYDAFVTKLRADGAGLLYSTFLGGSDEERGYGIAVNDSGNAYVTGFTWSSNFPITPDAVKRRNRERSDAFVTKLNASGSALVYSTYLGGMPDTDGGGSIALDGSDNVYVTGWTDSTRFPTTPGAFDTTYSGGFDDVFVTKFAEV